MKYTTLFLIGGVLFGQDVAPKMPEATAAASFESSAKSVLIIEPKARGADYVHAFDTLRKDKPSQKIMVRTASGVFTGVTEITLSTGGTLLFLKILSNQGTKIQIVPIEQFMEIGYSP